MKNLPIKKDKYCCQICNYVVISAKNKCEHILCDYCLTNIASSKIYECFLCQINNIKLKYQTLEYYKLILL
jgi:hypothetical protein